MSEIPIAIKIVAEVDGAEEVKKLADNLQKIATVSGKTTSAIESLGRVAKSTTPYIEGLSKPKMSPEVLENYKYFKDYLQDTNRSIEEEIQLLKTDEKERKRLMDIYDLEKEELDDIVNSIDKYLQETKAWKESIGAVKEAYRGLTVQQQLTKKTLEAYSRGAISQETALATLNRTTDLGTQQNKALLEVQKALYGPTLSVSQGIQKLSGALDVLSKSQIESNRIWKEMGPSFTTVMRNIGWTSEQIRGFKASLNTSIDTAKGFLDVQKTLIGPTFSLGQGVNKITTALDLLSKQGLTSTQIWSYYGKSFEIVLRDMGLGTVGVRAFKRALEEGIEPAKETTVALASMQEKLAQLNAANKSLTVTMGATGKAALELGRSFFWLGLGSMFVMMSLARVRRSERGVETATYSLKRAYLSLWEAEQDLNEALLEYGPMSREYLQAQLRVEEANWRVKSAEEGIRSALEQKYLAYLMIIFGSLPTYISASFNLAQALLFNKIVTNMLGKDTIKLGGTIQLTGNKAQITSGQITILGMSFTKAAIALSFLTFGLNLAFGALAYFLAEAESQRIMEDMKNQTDELTDSFEGLEYGLWGGSLVDAIKATAKEMEILKRTMSEVEFKNIPEDIRINLQTDIEGEGLEIDNRLETLGVTYRDKLMITGVEDITPKRIDTRSMEGDILELGYGEARNYSVRSLVASNIEGFGGEDLSTRFLYLIARNSMYLEYLRGIYWKTGGIITFAMNLLGMWSKEAANIEGQIEDFESTFGSYFESMGIQEGSAEIAKSISDLEEGIPITRIREDIPSSRDVESLSTRLENIFGNNRDMVGILEDSRSRIFSLGSRFTSYDSFMQEVLGIDIPSGISTVTNAIVSLSGLTSKIISNLPDDFPGKIVDLITGIVNISNYILSLIGISPTSEDIASLGEGIELIGDITGEVSDKIPSSFANDLGTIVSKSGTIADVISSLLDAVPSDLGDLLKSSSTGISNLFSGLAVLLGAIPATFPTLVVAAVKGITYGASLLVDLLTAGANIYNMLANIGNILDLLGDPFTLIETDLSALKDIMDTLVDAVDDIEIPEPVEDDTSNLLESIEDALTSHASIYIRTVEPLEIANPAIVEPTEQVIEVPENREININIYGPVIRKEEDIQRLAAIIKYELARGVYR